MSDFQRDRELADMAAQMSTETGRRFVHRLLSLSGYFGQPFHADPHIAAFNAGQRNLSVPLFDDLIAACPDRFFPMMLEAQRLARIDAERLARETQGEQE